MAKKEQNCLRTINKRLCEKTLNRLKVGLQTHLIVEVYKERLKLWGTSSSRTSGKK